MMTRKQQEIGEAVQKQIKVSKWNLGRHNVMNIDKDTIQQSVYQLHQDEDRYEKKNVKQTLEDVQRTLLMSRESDGDTISDEEANFNRVGFPAVQNFYDKYKSIDKSLERRKHKRQAPLAYLKQCEDLRLIPQTMGIVSLKGNNEVMNLKSFRVGNKYAQSIGKGLQLSQGITKVNLAQNRLSPTGGLKILKGINYKIQELDLSNNTLGNQLSGIFIANAIKQNNHLRVLDLGWNSCGSGGQNQFQIGKAWGEALLVNKTLQHLDLSFNKFSYNDVQVFADYLRGNHTLYGIHFQGNEGRIDSLGFLRNVILSDRSPRDQILNQKMDILQAQRRKNKSVQVMQKANYGQNTKISFNKDNCCWICEGWLENHFKVDLKHTTLSELQISDNTKEDHYNVFIHFDFDHWEGDLLDDQRKSSLGQKGKFQQHRMVPQGISYYFFSYEGRPFINMNEKKIQIDDYYRNQLRKDLKQANTFSRFQSTIYNFDLEYLNYIDTQNNQIVNELQADLLPKISKTQRESKPKDEENRTQNLVISSDYKVLLKYCIPRPDKELMNTSHVRARTPWTMEVSLFKDYLKEDKDDLWVNCFEFDWQNMKQLKYKQSSEAEVKSIMKQCYQLIKEQYKIQAGFGMIGNIFSVALNQYTEFIKEELKLIDGECLNQADSDRYFITVNANKRGPFIPANALVRCQFMEILIRLAVKRYFESQLAPNEASAVQMMIDNNLNPTSDHIIRAQQWRRKFLWNEQCDNLLKAYMPVFMHIYNNFGGTHRKPGQKMFMTVDEFENFVLTVPLVNDLFGQRDSSVAFNLAMMTQVNELDQDRHLSATFIEFLEAFCRVADKAAFEPINQSIQEGEEIQSMNIDERKNQSLAIKIENTIPYLMKNCCKRPFIEKQFEQPERDKEVGLFILTNGKYFQIICYVRYYNY
ncbi:UNKNOWN [Stylonychia lemnae]|uniref:Leucine rich repeat family protein n=1 Tax=Stylonychia lemnae TaxID=5949 RepID=A0A078AY50_STYLE|nr:UNKNOWN [Stylonychia lemnae]|eukprot:CDW85718.1 UNKNOWN [Stylonychia lemnae]